MLELNWGIIGCGNVTEVKSGPAFGLVKGSRVVAVMRRDGRLAKDYALRHNIPYWYDHAGELIGNPEVNAVYIATPPASHASYAIQVMETGKPAYVEKPMAANYADCKAMLDVSRKTGQPLYVAYYRRFLPYFIKVKEIISSGVLGDPLYTKIDFHIAPRKEDFNPDNLPWRVIPEIAGAGYFYDLACHQLDLLEWFFGKPKSAHGKSMNRRGLYKAEDVVIAELEYETGMAVAAHWCFVAGNNEHTDMIRVFGSKGSLEFSTFDFTPVKLSTENGVEEFLPENPPNIQYWYIRNMVAELQGEHTPTGNGESAMRTNLVMDQILGKIKQ